MLPCAKCHQGPEAATAALSLPGDTLLDEAAAKFGIHQTAFGAGGCFAQALILKLLASGEPGKLPGFEDCQAIPLRPNLYPDSAGTRRIACQSGAARTLLCGMIRSGFLDSESRQDLTELARDGSAAHRLARRANALVLLDNGMSCEAVAKVLLLDDDTIRTWYRLYLEDGIEGLASFGYEGGACRLSDEQQEQAEGLDRRDPAADTNEVGAWIEPGVRH